MKKFFLCVLSLASIVNAYAEEPECYDENNQPGKFYPTSRTTVSPSTKTTTTVTKNNGSWSIGGSAGVGAKASAEQVVKGQVGEVSGNLNVNGGYNSGSTSTQTKTEYNSGNSETNYKCVPYSKQK